ncbi:MAG: hypothetical protein MZW92_76745 [Comamonadaceae bacterium]|nr:hypothetical protein [Comamonadaceae bacterium]
MPCSERWSTISTSRVPVTPWEAALGATVDIPTLDGHARLKISAGVRAGQKLRLAGKGLPKPGGHGFGDLFAVLQIAVPGSLTEKEKSLFEDLARSLTLRPAPALRRKLTWRRTNTRTSWSWWRRRTRSVLPNWRSCPD